GSGDVVSVAATAGDAGGIACGTDGDCDETYPVGARVTLQARAAADSRFAGWDVASCANAAECEISLDGMLVVRATFVRNECEAGTTTCASDTTIVCDANGRVERTIPCDGNGCWSDAASSPATTGDGCAALLPSNALATYLDMAATGPELTLPAGTLINT